MQTTCNYHLTVRKFFVYLQLLSIRLVDVPKRCRITEYEHYTYIKEQKE